MDFGSRLLFLRIGRPGRGKREEEDILSSSRPPFSTHSSPSLLPSLPSPPLPPPGYTYALTTAAPYYTFTIHTLTKRGLDVDMG